MRPDFTVQDPAVPMIQLPGRFKSHRINVGTDKSPAGYTDIADIKGSGCIRHMWILVSHKEDHRIQITVDGADKPQVDMPLKAFFGIMHDWQPYRIDNAAFAVMPNYDTPRMPGYPGYNCFLPIPFETSCHIRIAYTPGDPDPECNICAMIDWQEYENGPGTPYRFAAAHTLLTPAPKRGGQYTALDVSGEGFVAGVTQGFLQRNFTDMIYHTGGMTFLIDGETEPYTIYGHNVEDDYGFTWGFHEHQTKWVGVPYHRWAGRCDQDGVVYRFFGPDPIYFNSSLSFRCGCRDDDVETVVYYYYIPGTDCPAIDTPDQWEVIGMLPDGNKPEVFTKEDVFSEPVERDGKRYVTTGDEEYELLTVPKNRGWLNFRYAGYDKDYFYLFRNRCAYGRTRIHADRDKEVTLKLSFANDMILWVNGERMMEKRHMEFGTERVTVRLKKGDNAIQIKTNTLLEHPLMAILWSVHFAVEQ